VLPSGLACSPARFPAETRLSQVALLLLFFARRRATDATMTRQMLGLSSLSRQPGLSPRFSSYFSGK